ncbi:hypothetical protein D3C71_1688870 [compost metagenome]
MLFWRDGVRRGKTTRQIGFFSLRVDEMAVGRQLEGDYLDLLFGLLAGNDHVAHVTVGERWFNAV